MTLTLMDGFDHYAMTEAAVLVNPQMAAKGWQRQDEGIGGLAVFIEETTGRISGTAFRYRCTSGGLAGIIHIHKQLPVPLTTVTVGFACAMSTLSGSQIVFRVRTAGLGKVAAVRVNADGSISVLNAADSVVDTSAAGLFFGSVWNYVELQLVIAGGSGTCEAQLNGANVIGPTTGNFGTTDAGEVDMVADRNTMPNGCLLDFDDLYVIDDTSPNDDFLGDIHIYTILPTGDGSHLDWTPNSGTSHYDRVDENPPDDDVTYVYDSTTGHQDTYTYPSVAGSDIKGVQLNQYARKGDGAFRQIAPLVVSGGNDYTGTPQTCVASYVDLTTRYDEDPDTPGFAWTVAGFNAAEFGSETG